MTTPAADRRKVMISSTAWDMPEHRQRLLDACAAQGFEPIMSPQMAADAPGVLQAALEVVDEAVLYVAIFTYRYGLIPENENPLRISVFEAEFRRAVEWEMPRLIYFMHDEHPVRPSDFDAGKGANKLKKLKAEIAPAEITGFFKSPAHLQSLVTEALTKTLSSNG